MYSGWQTYLAQVAEVAVSESGEVRVHRIVCAVDCGSVVNPDIVKAQIEGGVIFGIGGALWGEVTLKNGRVRSEEHTSELQSRLHLVCRLLLEKKKKSATLKYTLASPTAHTFSRQDL